MPLFAKKFAPLQAASLTHIRAQLITESAFSLRRAFSTSRKAFSSMRKNTPCSSSADVFGVDEKAHIRANTFHGKICGKRE